MRMYLDWNACAPLRAEAHKAMLAALEVQANPSSPHQEGQMARDLLEEARSQLCELVGAERRELLFSSSATEALNLAVNGLAFGPASTGRKRVVITETEHAGLREPALALAERGFEVVEAKVDSCGRVDLDSLSQVVDECTLLVGLIHVNNETGVINNVSDVASLCQTVGARLLLDAAQSAGKLALNWSELGADLMTLSSAKLGGPLGAGALVCRRELKLAPMLLGGQQERSRRAGSEAVPSCVGFGSAAAAASPQDWAEQVSPLTRYFERGLGSLSRQSRVIGADAPRAAGTTSVCLEGADAENLVMQLDLTGLACSTGSACASGSSLPSHVLLALGLSTEDAASTLRFSFGPSLGTDELDLALEATRAGTEAAAALRCGVQR